MVNTNKARGQYMCFYLKTFLLCPEKEEGQEIGTWVSNNSNNNNNNNSDSDSNTSKRGYWWSSDWEETKDRD